MFPDGFGTWFQRYMRSFSQSLLHTVSMMLAQYPTPHAKEGVVTGGTWDPSSENGAGTCEVVHGDTYCAGADGTDDTPIPDKFLRIATTHVGDQYGPVGNERAILIPAHGGPVVFFVHGQDDSPQAPAGERWITHRNANGETDLYLKFTNDGDDGDKKGGIAVLSGSRFSLVTAAGFSVVADDAAKTFTIQSPGGTVIVIDDNTSEVDLGATGLDATEDAVVTQRYLQDAVDTLRSNVQTAFDELAASVQSGPGVSPPTVADLTTQGSSIVKAAQ